jgi:hypothetical protein
MDGGDVLDFGATEQCYVERRGEGTDSTHWISRSTVVTLTTTPLIVAPQSIPKIGIYASGAQNLLFAIANRLPRSETGMVDPTIANKTAGNCQNPLHDVAPHWEVPCGTRRAGRMGQSLAVHSKRVVHSPCQKISVLIC